MNWKLAFAFTMGLLLGQLLVTTIKASSGDGWRDADVREVVHLLRQIAKNTER